MNTPLIAATVTLLLAAPALASAGHDMAPVEPSAPVAIRDALASGGGTVAGTVVQVDGRGFTVADASGQVRVRARHGARVQAGDPVTVTGHADGDRMKALQVIHSDGSMAQPGGHRHDHRHGQDHD